MCNFFVQNTYKILKLNFYDITHVNFVLFLTLEENFENIYSPSNQHILSINIRKTTLCDWSVSCDVML